MKDDFKVQRVVPVADRTVNYRPASRPVSMDMIGVRPVAAPVTQIAPVTPAAVPEPAQPVVADDVVSNKTTESARKIDEPQSTPEKAPRSRGKSLRPIFGAFAALTVLGITGYVSFDTWISTNVVRKTTPTVAAVQGDTTTASEGSDETVISDSAIKAYAVAPDLPRVLSIEKLNVKARILPMGINAQSAIEAPVNIYDSGWYTGSAKPGTPGVSFIDAHASGATREGLFAYLDTLNAGDIITVEKGNGEILKYAVRSKETKQLADIKMSDVLSPRPGIKEGLTIMTCTGKWMASDETYDHRVIVYTERI